MPVFCAEFDVLTQLTGFKLTRGMLCAMRRKPLPDIKELCENKKRIVILDRVMNPTNVGAIICSTATLLNGKLKGELLHAESTAAIPGCDTNRPTTQIKVVSPEDFLDAKIHPENHRNLNVRVGGYSDYFVNLDCELQDNVIERTFI